ncbi:hypothetical protein CAPTEDRAFT_224037 [Capitella teleta]|uniref:SERTA domain-containing protein n=1 Tax=Capitella teleta TaxID=283909 RepID=R7V238_CAPTE|nr:hypothetical protein CAPTEDRAFT_224037 [Capitella teleta]|eukprot:ELU12552.1 hypothetical protein CAPTEDRAFT_224037 [Capitella teleta]
MVAICRCLCVMGVRVVMKVRAPRSSHVDPPRVVAKRKMVAPENAPSKRTPPMVPATEGDHRRRRVLRQTFEKLRRLDDPERCMLRSVLLHNTTRRLQRELIEDVPSAAWLDVWNDQTTESPSRLFKHVLTFSREQELAALAGEDLSAALEKAFLEPSEKKPLSAVPIWNFAAHAATVTGPPLIAGSITMGTPVVSKETNVPKPTPPPPSPARMELESLRTDLLLTDFPEDNNNIGCKPAVPHPSSSPPSSLTSVSSTSSSSCPSSSSSSPIVNSATTLVNLSHDLDCMMAEYMTCSSRAASYSLSCVYLNGDQTQSNSLVAVP